MFRQSVFLAAASSELPRTVTHLTWDFEHFGSIYAAGLHLLDQQRQACRIARHALTVTGWARSPFTCSDWPTNSSPPCIGVTAEYRKKIEQIRAPTATWITQTA
ncbi:hypothetical protein F8R89_00960 [Streptomyces sp. SS1-1]|uniref:hypothetical protein n=1 Tax=Streptomyces sp. SS1-1 TaxID=2651869 RepID=UPI00124F82E7|nr:hypothetical protein [Streptomyces sp. SS1-1]KAB2976926.1 hypothetical protein F8R89_35965 [Streptomyces sp. SS1-1]KAB2977447.1 hypothetical protein F8R89_01265 [Streptomyces sp. SS1-1]KAB2977640.1 hypothetical protein F8R89_00960 [Streptomyces sp. SS1-1]